MSWLNSADMNTEVHVSFHIKVFPGYTPRNGTAEAYGSCIFSFFKGIFILFSIMVVPTNIPTNSVQGFPFFHTVSSICYF